MKTPEDVPSGESGEHFLHYEFTGEGRAEGREKLYESTPTISKKGHRERGDVREACRMAFKHCDHEGPPSSRENSPLVIESEQDEPCQPTFIDDHISVFQ